ncbi:MAG: hypothetical protein CMB80_01950 [Flammeovirgaceae bacterium]|nr:hypothetical protein [Flammeovirgaceae bacterium]
MKDLLSVLILSVKVENGIKKMENVKKLYPAKKNDSRVGKNNHNWNGGSAGYKDHHQMKLNRLEKLKQAKGKCEVCGKNAKTIHHIDETNYNHDMSNLIVVCKVCHGVLHSKDLKGCYNSKYVRKYGMNIEEMADRLGLNKSTVTTYLSNKAKREEILLKLGIKKKGARA